MPEISSIKEEDVYLLPPDEIIAKYICISLYSGKFSLDFVNKMADKDTLRDRYSKNIEYLKRNGYINLEDNECILTRKGFLHYGAVAALFWSENHQEKYEKMIMGGKNVYTESENRNI